MVDERASLHLCVDSSVVAGVDALSNTWHTTRNDAANRLLDEAVGRHIPEIEAFAASLREQWSYRAKEEP